ncbi:histidinol-phosphatase HisJ family protein [Chitinivibrio alkaliphilus]|uniref:histidinol-phosphatase n=1 Tax=Chitinivibrio alkaliphilus ACht1 TaxID=1313304 RepID=U7DBU2_9BACT|nr:histidinol-phosphatase HisJ family protein [Chitinivibrio alkaliphilus]ERP31875.1 histidinol phosphate phosphatase HisJ family [Chitinivibrio alkaliphilus ACht1]
MEEKARPFIWETHGIHMGTDNDHVKHGVDAVDEIVEKAIAAEYPGITFVIHAPRLTGFRYQAEVDTDIKFIRGDLAYMRYADRVERLRKKYGDQIAIRYGVELDWMGSGIGLQWNRAKAFQAKNADFFIGSVHFSPEGLPYDGSQEEADALVEMRGGVHAYWAGYIEEMIEMVENFSDMIQVVGHLDLPKLRVPLPPELQDIERSDAPLARRMRTLLDCIRGHNLALDVNLAGEKKGVGVYPVPELLQRARALSIPVCIGTDTHAVADLGHNYDLGISYVRQCGYTKYLSFSHRVPEKRLLAAHGDEHTALSYVNRAMALLNSRFSGQGKQRIPRVALGEDFAALTSYYPDALSLGCEEGVKVLCGKKSIAVSRRCPEDPTEGGKVSIRSMQIVRAFCQFSLVF